MTTKKITCTLDKDVVKRVDRVSKIAHRRSRSDTINYLLHCALDLPEFLGGPSRKELAQKTLKKLGREVLL